MRIIDADALVIDYYDDVETEDDVYTYAYVSKSQIDNAPTIDAVSVVRCAVCNKWKPQGYEDGYGWCLHHQSETRADDYCSYGERKEK